jgi:hypothetical protein
MNTMIKKIHIQTGEMFNEETNEFIPIDGGTITLEHSLIAIRDWEAKYHTNFIGNKNLTSEQLADYIRCMCIENPEDANKIEYITAEQMNEIAEYMEDKMTAQQFRSKGKPNRDTITAEKIYGWMIMNQMPIAEFEHWHINRLLVLLRVCANNNAPPKQMSQKEIMAENAKINAMNRAKFKSKG